jgi:hypothetical protein
MLPGSSGYQLQGLVNTDRQDPEGQYRSDFVSPLVVNPVASKVVLQIGIDPLDHTSLIVMVCIGGERQIEPCESLLLFLEEFFLCFELC